MIGLTARGIVLLVTGLVAAAALARAGEPTQSEREAMYYRYLEFPSYVKGGSIEPHWMTDGSSFWYAEGSPANTDIWKVDPVANTKQPLFDTERLRQALTPLLGHKPPYRGLPFAEFTFVDGEKAVQFAVEDKEYVLQLDTYTITQAPALSEEEKSRLVPQAGEALSPDRRWFAGVKEHNLWLRSTSDGSTVQITTDGIEDYAWNMDGARWSPDSFKLVVQKADYRKVPKIPIVHWLRPTEEVEWVVYPKAGEPWPQTELFVVDVLSKRQVRVDIGEESGQDIYIFGWRPDGFELLFFRLSRDHKKLDLMAANSETGSTRVILTDTQKTFVRFPFCGWCSPVFTLLEDGMRFIWMSERGGWNHLYLYDLGGNFLRRLTEGSFPVLRVVAVDEQAGWVYFTAHGDRQRPYDTHLYRVNLEGKEFTRLTEAPGQHDAPRMPPWLLARSSPIQFAPSKQFFLNTHSTPIRPPAVELRRADGTLLQTLSKANIDALKDLKWRPPEEFAVKAADGNTDLYGILYKPYDFDPNKKYPVIESIYSRPEWTVVPQTFTSNWWGIPAQALAQLGFITFIVEGRGTSERGKAFQDVVYGNIGRYEIPDHVAALKQLAEERPYMDLSRVGIKGESSGGYLAVRALLLTPDVYHVGVASAPPVGGSAWYIGLPQNNKEAHDYASNLRLVGNLKGKMLLIHGTSDRVIPFSETMKLVEALIRANKPYDLIVLPEFRHLYGGTSEIYWREAIRRYFQEHLKP